MFRLIFLYDATQILFVLKVDPSRIDTSLTKLKLRLTLYRAAIASRLTQELVHLLIVAAVIRAFYR